MHLSIENIGPDQAAEYLSRNTSNRPLISAWINRIAEMMTRGEWALNGEAIKIASNGTILDGQHRLHAIIKAKITTPITVISGLPESVFQTLDQGKRRSAADVFAIDGYKNTRSLAGGVRAIYIIENGGVFGRYLSPALLRSVLGNHPLAHKWTSIYTSSKTARTIFPAAIIAIATLGEERHDESVAGYFIDKLFSGVGLEEKSPILLLRERLIEARRGSLQMPYAGMVTIAVKAWNAFVSNSRIGILRYNSTEAFPAMK